MDCEGIFEENNASSRTGRSLRMEMFSRQCEMCGWYSDKAPNIHMNQDRLRRLEQLRKSYNDRYQEWVSANKRFGGIVAAFDKKAKNENNRFRLPLFHKKTYMVTMTREIVELFCDGIKIDFFRIGVKKPDVCMHIPRYIECEICGHRKYIDPVKLRIDVVDDDNNIQEHM